MGSDNENMVMINKRQHYDITMSRRTRRPTVEFENGNRNSVKVGSVTTMERELDINRKSLKQLIMDDGNGNLDGGVGEGTSSLGQHFTQAEPQLQIVVKQQKDSLHGMKLKKMVSRYVEVLGHLMKKNRDPSQKKAILRFSL